MAAALAWELLAHAAGEPPVALALFYGVLAVAWGALACAWWWTRAPARLPLRAVVAWGLVFRIVGLFSEPVLEDDHYRYLWDGRATAVAGTPYGHAPEDWFEDEKLGPVFEPILDRVNNPDVPTIYPPAAQVVFVTGHALEPGSLLPIKAILVVADLLTLALLVGVASPRKVLLYAWCPLLVHETAFTGHVESLGVLFAVAAFVRVARGPLDGRTAAFAAGLGALAVASKLLAVLLIPLLALRIVRGGVRVSAIAALSFAGVLALVYAPFVAPLLASGRVGVADLAGLAVFVSEWEFNSTGFALLSAWGGRGLASAIGLAATSAAWVAAWRSSVQGPDEVLPRGEWIFGAFFLFAPVVNPWYLLWLVPFLTVRPAAWGILALVAVPLSYCHGLFLAPGLPPYHHPLWVRPLEVGLVGMGVAAGWASRRARGGRIERGTLFRRTAVASGTASRIGCILLFAMSLVAVEADASGTYMGRPSRPTATVDRASYELGKQVFAGEFVATERAGQQATQADLLGKLQERLPPRVRARVDLTGYAGQLSDEQVDALRYYLERRYKVKVDG